METLRIRNVERDESRCVERRTRYPNVAFGQWAHADGRAEIWHLLLLAKQETEHTPWREASLLNLYGANSRLDWVRRVALAVEAHAVGAWLSVKPHVARHFRRLVANQQALFLLVGVGLV